jgi:hypothetical protein
MKKTRLDAKTNDSPDDSADKLHGTETPCARSWPALLTGAVIVFTLSFASSSFAQKEISYLSEFADSLGRYIGMGSSRLEATAEKTFLAKQSLLEQWGFFPAAASYRPLIDTISLPLELVRSDGIFRLRIKTLDQLRAERGHLNAYEIGMIFHELSHAEFEHLVQKEVSPSDAALKRMFDLEILPWLKAGFPKLSNRQVRVAAWELFGYYRHEALQQVLELREAILEQNGLYATKDGHKCIVQRSKAERYATSGEPEDLRENAANLMGPIAERIHVPVVFVMGKEIEFSRANGKPYDRSWDQRMWNHFSEHHLIPATGEELAQLLWQQNTVRTRVQRCWQEAARKTSVGKDLNP